MTELVRKHEYRVVIVLIVFSISSLFCSSCVLTTKNISYNKKAIEYLEKASELEAEGEYGKAIVWVDKAIATDSKNWSSYTLRGKIYESIATQLSANGAELNDIEACYQKAISDYKRASQIDPQSILSLYSIAEIFIQLKQFDRAREYAEKIEEIHPDDSLAKSLLEQIEEAMNTSH